MGSIGIFLLKIIIIIIIIRYGVVWYLYCHVFCFLFVWFLIMKEEKEEGNDYFHTNVIQLTNIIIFTYYNCASCMFIVLLYLYFVKGTQFFILYIYIDNTE